MVTLQPLRAVVGEDDTRALTCEPWLWGMEPCMSASRTFGTVHEARVRPPHLSCGVETAKLGVSCWI